MTELHVHLENCYGIRSLTHRFDFRTDTPYAVYAPNGFMKSSFAKCFEDLSRGSASSDRMFPKRVSVRAIRDEDQRDIEPDKVLVVRPYDETFQPERVSLLLVNDALKRQYDDAVARIEERRADLIKVLKQRSGLTGRTATPESELCAAFAGQSLFDLVEVLTAAAGSVNELGLAEVSYAELFNDKTRSLLESGTIATQLKDYVSRYDALVRESPILSQKFTHYHAQTVHKNLADNGFFDARHSVNLFDGTAKQEVSSARELQERIENEKQRVLADAGLRKAFDELDRKLSANAELRRFREYLRGHPDLIPRLVDPGALERDLWSAYLAAEPSAWSAFAEEYRKGKAVMDDAVRAARSERTEWEAVIELFTKRFHVPFRLRVENQPDVILKQETPEIAFDFVDEEETRVPDRGALLQVLSQGERRALYLLNVLFEIEVRKKSPGRTILVVDDVADSFDYQNKYAIVEYLRDIVTCGSFSLIVLSHNYDFHRTIGLRLGIAQRDRRLLAVRTGREISLVPEQYQWRSPFNHWKKNLREPRFLVAAIPFVRNLAEYCGRAEEELQLTSVLHQKADTRTITLADLQDVFSRVLHECPPFVPPLEGTRGVVDLVYETADQIASTGVDFAELESKVVLSIAIRLRAEAFMTSRIADVPDFHRNQTAELVSLYRSQHSGDTEVLGTLARVQLMTPENIHLNSFMYEPILDMSAAHLRQLWGDVKALGD